MACLNCDSGGEGCGDSRIAARGQRGARVCVKCKMEVASVAVGNQSEPLCTGCLHASLLAKFKTAVNNNGLVASSDKVLVAFSGGPASRVAFEFLKEIRSKAQIDAGAANDRGLKVFALGAVFVDERIVLPLSPFDAQAAVDEIRSIFDDGGTETLPLHVVRLESIYDNDLRNLLTSSSKTENSESNGKQEVDDDRAEKVVELFQSVQDSTGKEDLLECLRMQAIQKVAQEHGYNKVVLGLCTSRIAARVIAATTKGRGFSLSADIQYLDARWPVPVVLPLRDCVARELSLFCYFSRFKTVFMKGLTTMAGPGSSLNNLAHTFITSLQEENSSREYTIVRTAAKLKSFGFNRVIEPPNRRRKNSVSSKEDFSQSKPNSELDILCSICCAPVDTNDIWIDGKISSSAEKTLVKTETTENLPLQPSEFRSTCCPSCRFQIFAEEGQKACEKYGLLPKDMRQRGTANFERRQTWMRSQVESYVLAEEDNNYLS